MVLDRDEELIPHAADQRASLNENKQFRPQIDFGARGRTKEKTLVGARRNHLIGIRFLYNIENTHLGGGEERRARLIHKSGRKNPWALEFNRDEN